MAPPQSEVAHIWLQPTTHLSTPKGWKAVFFFGILVLSLCLVILCLLFLVVGWKLLRFQPILYWSPANRSRSEVRTKVGTHAQLKGRQRSRNFGRDRISGGEMEGSDVSPTSGFFVSNTRRLFGNRPIFAKFGHDTWIVSTQV